MQYFRCQCGGSWSLSKSQPAPCHVCPTCNSTFVEVPGIGHSDPIPHDFSLEDTRDALVTLVCRWCNKTQAEVLE